MKRIFTRAGVCSLAPALLLTLPVFAQVADPHAGHHMPSAQADPAGAYLMTMNSGTSVAPASWPMPMLMPKVGSWNAMLMGQGFLVGTQQYGPRGADKIYAP